MTDRGCAEAALAPLLHPLTCKEVASPNSLLTVRPNVDERIVGHHQLVEVELVSKPFALCLVKNPLVVIISIKER